MERPRIDIWLKLVCLFKHRADATEACKGGKVKVNGLRAKPSALIRIEDVVEFQDAADEYRRVVVREIPNGNVAKEIARTMYLDETPVRPKAPLMVERERGAGRPTKKDRRDLERVRR